MEIEKKPFLFFKEKDLRLLHCGLSTRCWSSVLRQESQSEEEAFDKFFELFNAFLNTKENVNTIDGQSGECSMPSDET